MQVIKGNSTYLLQKLVIPSLQAKPNFSNCCNNQQDKVFSSKLTSVPEHTFYCQKQTTSARLYPTSHQELELTQQRSDCLLCLQYMQNCNSVWVVSNIHRAVDNKIAKDLLGEHFRRQLLMDGQYSSVSFICTKTDIVNTSETIRLLFIFCVLYGYQSNRPKITALQSGHRDSLQTSFYFIHFILFFNMCLTL